MTCTHCGDAGSIPTDTGFLACSCPAGEKFRQPMFAPSDKEKKFPQYLPIFSPTRGIIPPSDARDRQIKDDA